VIDYPVAQPGPDRAADAGQVVSTELAVVIGAVLMLVFVTLAGLRSAAWSSARRTA
jgi:Na+/proline symporter